MTRTATRRAGILNPGWVGTLGSPAAPSGAVEDLVVSQVVDPADLRHLLSSLEGEDCVHSWRNFGSRGSLEELVAWENQLRPTTFFFFFRRDADGLLLVGAGTVADRLTAAFPHPGFCILSRCYIMPEFRGQGLYRKLLHFRMEHCGTRFGAELNGIHIGSVDRRVSHVLVDHRLPGWPTFTHLGDQELYISGESRTVGAYMLLMPRFLERLRDESAGDGVPDGVARLRRMLDALDTGPVRDLGLLAQRAFDEAREAGGFGERGGVALEQLLVFCRSLPLVGMAP